MYFPRLTDWKAIKSASWTIVSALSWPVPFRKIRINIQEMRTKRNGISIRMRKTRGLLSSTFRLACLISVISKLREGRGNLKFEWNKRGFEKKNLLHICDFLLALPCVSRILFQPATAILNAISLEFSWFRRAISNMKLSTSGKCKIVSNLVRIRSVLNSTNVPPCLLTPFYWNRNLNKINACTRIDHSSYTSDIFL